LTPEEKLLRANLGEKASDWCAIHRCVFEARLIFGTVVEVRVL